MKIKVLKKYDINEKFFILIGTKTFSFIEIPMIFLYDKLNITNNRVKYKASICYWHEKNKFFYGNVMFQSIDKAIIRMEYNLNIKISKNILDEYIKILTIYKLNNFKFNTIPNIEERWE